jgi:predicted RNA-binding protein with PUA-like domain
MNYWLMKSEPDTFGIDDLKASGTEPWDGIRNYQARNLMRDEMKVGDGVLFYHSNAKPPGVVGVAEIASEAYTDPTQFDPDEKYYDAKSKPDNPRWLLLDVKYVSHFPRIIPLSELKETPGLEEMMVTRKGMRLSIQPVTQQEWEIVHNLAEQEG